MANHTKEDAWQNLLEAPVVVVDARTLSGEFHRGLLEGVYVFGVAFPFLMVFLLGWLMTILWIPFAMRIARRLGKKTILQLREQLSERSEEQGKS